MPTSYFTKAEATGAFFSHLAMKYKITVPEAQQRWAFAKDRAAKDGHPNNVQYILEIIEEMRGDKDRFAQHLQKKQDQRKTLQDKSDLYRPAAPSANEKRETKELKETLGPGSGSEKANLVAPIFTFNAVIQAVAFPHKVSSVTQEFCINNLRTSPAESWRAHPKTSAHRNEFVRRASLRFLTK